MPYRKVDNPVSFIYDQGFYSVDEYPKINLSEDRSGKKLLEERQKFFSGNLDICLFKKKKKTKKYYRIHSEVDLITFTSISLIIVII